ncbi:MAG TPA: hypothetical protein VFI63_04305, partial [Solirubrobacterales bacterium]|nr:hypothetical protein [Solirubrobacterales bacterium]
VAGPQRSRSMVGRAASSVLIGFLVAGLFEDLTFLPGFDLIVLVLAAVALLDASAVRWERFRLPRAAAWFAGAAAAAVLVVVLVGDAAAVAFRLGTESVWAGRWPDAVGWYRAAVAIDPWHPSSPKALTVAADAIGDEPLAISAARSAVRLNPGDGASWTNLALLCLGSGDSACVAQALGGAERTAGTTGLELVNAALVEEVRGDLPDADRLYGLSLLTNPSTALATAWPRPVALPIGEVDTSADPSPELTALLAQAATGETPTLPRTGPLSVRALALAILGERAAAETALASAERDAAADPLTWQLAALLRQHWGEDPSQALRVVAFLTGSPVPYRPASRPQVTYEVASLRPYPGDLLVRSAHRLTSDPPWPWILDRYLPREAGS